MTSGSQERLRQFPNVKALIGDSFEVLPEMLRQHAHRRIGIFIDGRLGLVLDDFARVLVGFIGVDRRFSSVS